MAKDLVRQVGTQTWHVAPEWADVLFPSNRAESLAGLIEAEGGRTVKQGQGRRIVRLELGGRRLFVKQYSGSRRLRRLPRKEWRVANWARRAGLPTVEPVAACWKGGAFYVTAETPGARSLGDLIYSEYFEPAADEPPYPGHRPPELVRLHRRRRTPGPGVPDPRTLADMIVRLLTDLHSLGLRHTDLHPNNLLVVRRDDRWHLEVLDLPTLEEMPGSRTVIEHLVQLNHFFEPLATRTERLRVMQLLERHGLSLDGGPRHIESETRRYRREFYSRRDRRCVRQSKYFRAVRTGRFGGMVAADWAERLPATEDELAAALEIAEYVKKSRGGLSGFATIGGCRVFIKRDTQASWRRPHGPWPRILEDWLRGSRAKRAWRRGHALLVRGVGTARPLVWVDRSHGLLGREGIIVTAAVEGHRPLEQTLEGLCGRERAASLETVAREIRRLHDSGLSHRDLKAQNILLRRDGSSWRVALVDMDGLCRHRRAVGNGRRVRDLMRLAFSWDWGYGVRHTVPGLSLCDCLRFLKTYLGPHMRQAITVSCRRRGSTAPAARLRWWWRGIRRAMDRKAAKKA
ncbi:MAG: hypothetical protein JXL80_02830 [Planctomycetes bacterium]|nr:hypothetical protein [Planctomycetota bacterium]